MTVSTVVDHNDYTGNGVTTSFPYTFRIFKKSDLTVSVIDLIGTLTVLVLDTDYTVTNAGGYNGGSVVLTTPLANGWQISIARELEPTQETDLRNQGKFFAEVHEDAFDKLTMLIQQVSSLFRLALRKPSSIANWYDALNNYIRNLKDPRDPQDAATKNYTDNLVGSNFNRTLRVPESSIPQLPPANLRANMIQGFDSAGNPVMLVPQSGSAADVLLQLASTDPGKGDALIAVKQPYTNSVARTQHDVNADYISVKDFGAVGDGVTNDTNAIQTAINYASLNGVGLYAPSGRYRVDKLYLKPHVSITGEYIGDEGKGTSFLGNGVEDVFYGINTNELFQTSGVGAEVPYVHHVTLKGFEIDGGVNGVDVAFSPSLNGRGIAIFGSSLNFVDIDVINTGGHGIETAYHDSAAEWSLYFRESSFRNIRIRNVGKHGWWYRGPHDAKLLDVSIINASRCADNTYDGFISEVEGSCDIIAMHSSCSGVRAGDFENIRHRYSGNFGGGCHIVCSSFEGARSAGVLMKGAGNYMDSTCSVYAPFGQGSSETPLIVLSGATNCILKGAVDGSGYPSNTLRPVGLRFDPAAPSFRNYIDLQFTTIPNPISFGASYTTADGDGGDNHITGRAIYYGATAFNTYGVLNSANGSSIDFQFIGAANYRLTSQRQSRLATINAGSPFTWTFKYPFRSSDPIVLATIQSPSGSGNLSNGFWISSKGKNSVTFYNGTTQQITLNMIAEEPVLVS